MEDGTETHYIFHCRDWETERDFLLSKMQYTSSIPDWNLLHTNRSLFRLFFRLFFGSGHFASL